jgi:uncharacterized protein YjbJ (UPF0337 family)
MNKDQVKGTIDEVRGSAKRKAGELTGDTGFRVKGIAQQVKGKLENTWGKAKSVVHEAGQEARVQHDTRVKLELNNPTADVEATRASSIRSRSH